MEDNEENETKEIRKVRNKGMADVTKLSRKQRNFLLFWEGNKRNDDPSYVPLSIPSLAKKYKCTYPTAKRWVNSSGPEEENFLRKKRKCKDKNKKVKSDIKQFIIKNAGDKLTCSQGASANSIAHKIMKKFKTKYSTRDKDFKLSCSTVRRWMNILLTPARKLKKSFALKEKELNERINFCRKICENKDKFKNIFFTDEKIFSLNRHIHLGNNWVRLTKNSSRRLNNGDPQIEKLIESNVPKFSKGFMVAGGISNHGPGKLIFITGSQDSYAYLKTLKYFKEDINFINQKFRVDLIFQQDNAPTHTSDKSTAIIKDLFYKKLELTEEEKKIKNRKPKSKLLIKKNAKESKENFNSAKAIYLQQRENTIIAQEAIEKRFIELNEAQDFMIEKWPANSPVNILLIYYLLGFKSNRNDLGIYGKRIR